MLVVDDEASNRALLQRCLEKEGYRVRAAENGIVALRIIREDPPDVVLMDMMMPELDGLEATRRLKSDPETAHIPIIVISARNDPADIVNCLEVGADEFVPKPIRKAEVLVRVRSMARLRRERSDLLRSYELRGEQVRVLALLLEFCRQLGQAESEDDVIRMTLETTAQLAIGMNLMVLRPGAEDSGFLHPVQDLGITDAAHHAVALPVETSLAGKACRTRVPVVANPGDEEADHVCPEEHTLGLDPPVLYVPLVGSEGVLAVLAIAGRIGDAPIGRREQEYVELVANIAEPALQNAINRRARDEARDLIMVALAKLAEHRDSETGRHVERVTQYALILADELRQQGGPLGEQIDDQFLEALERAVPLHDIGKVAIPDAILRKPGQLTPEEMEIMRSHASIGAATLKPIIQRVRGSRFLSMAVEIIESHHERYDGTGYPNGLAGEEIPLSARITAVADVYDALTTARSYKKAFPHERAKAILCDGAGTQFDPDVVRAFLAREEDFARLARELADPVEEPRTAPASTKDRAVAAVSDPA